MGEGPAFDLPRNFLAHGRGCQCPDLFVIRGSAVPLGVLWGDGRSDPICGSQRGLPLPVQYM